MEIKTIADAIAVLEYLHRRELLCDTCGSQLAEYRNQFHARCSLHKSPTAQYSRVAAPNELERRIAQALTAWTDANTIYSVK